MAAPSVALLLVLGMLPEVLAQDPDSSSSIGPKVELVEIVTATHYRWDERFDDIPLWILSDGKLDPETFQVKVTLDSFDVDNAWIDIWLIDFEDKPVALVDRFQRPAEGWSFLIDQNPDFVKDPWEDHLPSGPKSRYFRLLFQARDSGEPVKSGLFALRLRPGG